MAYSWSIPIENPAFVDDKGSLKLLPDNAVSILENTEVSSSWFFGENYKNLQWNNEKLLLPEEPNALLFEGLRGTDIPKWNKPPCKATRECPFPVANAYGTLVMEQGGKHIFQGHGIDTSSQEVLRWRTSFDSQLPSLTLDYRQGQQNDHVAYRIKFFGNKTMENASYHSPMAIRKDPTSLIIPSHHQQAAKDGRLMAIKLQFGNVATRDGPNITHRWLDSIIVLHGDPMDRWQNDQAMTECLTGAHVKEMYSFDRIVAHMLTEDNLSLTFFRECPEDKAPNLAAWTIQYDYWEFVMRLACANGFCWFYRQEKSDQPGLGDKPSRPPPVAFWLVSKFSAHVKDGRLEKLEPIEWGPIASGPKPGKESTLTANMESYLRKLGLLRVRIWQAKARSEDVRAAHVDQANEVAPRMPLLFCEEDWMTLAARGEDYSDVAQPLMSSSIELMTHSIRKSLLSESHRPQNEWLPDPRPASSSAPSRQEQDDTWLSLAQSSATVSAMSFAEVPTVHRPRLRVCSWCFLLDHDILDCPAKITILEHDRRAEEYFREHPSQMVCAGCYERGHGRLSCTATLKPMERERRRELWKLEGPR